MKKVFHNIHWNLANLNEDAALKTYAFVYAKPPYLVMKNYAPFSKRQSWFLLGLKQRQKNKKKKKKNAYYHKKKIF